MSQGRRTPSMKASIVAMSRPADLAKEISFKEIAFNANTNCTPSPAAVESTSSGTAATPRAPRSKKYVCKTLFFYLLIFLFPLEECW